MNSLDRRAFLKHAVLTSTVAAAAGISINAGGANERVVLGLMGLRGRGSFLAPLAATRDDVELRYLADPDTNFFEQRAGDIEKHTGKRPVCMQDFREMLDDPELDGILMATPDHWHALGTIWACQAGKDVYVEKPASHNIWEGQQMVKAARKYDRVVQMGTQNRSAEYCQKAYEYVHSKDFGDIHFVRVMNSKQHGNIGKKENTDVPPGVNYDIWLGPAPMRPFNENHFHYAWHWLWAYSGGDIINDGIHQIDIAHWLIDQPLPKAVCAAGGKHFFDDDQEAPDTHTVNWEFDRLTMVFEQTLWAPYMKKTPMEVRDLDLLPNWPFSGTRIEVYGTEQFMFLGRHGGGWEVFDKDGNSVRVEHGYFERSNKDHLGNFIDCIRSREKPRADIELGHRSTLLSHYGNIAYRTGRKLSIDPATEGFINDDEANGYVKRQYREPWVVPEEV
ncbi:MAG TPA: Gfo/Idh/MocA family oxidoreductase [Candidatus Hydrogenedentes bacterium]|nr:Gfo/Idh/MocA family oxidoreductase [Candidatus Hydrogenedentota bacterium]